MPFGLGPAWDQIVLALLLIVSTIGGVHLYKKTVRPRPGPSGS